MDRGTTEGARRERGASLPLVGWTLAVALGIGLVILGAAGGDVRGTAVDAYRPTGEDRAVAIGLYLDSPRSPEVTDKALVLSEKLRALYGIDTGNAFADREQAALRAHREFLDRLVFEDDEIRDMARDLGYSLDPAECANYCDNVHDLAVIELKRTALDAFANGRRWPGRMGAKGEFEELEIERRAVEAGIAPEE